MSIETFNKELTTLLSDRYSISEAARNNHAKGEDIFDPVLPLGVAFPNTTEEVSQIVKVWDFRNFEIHKNTFSCLRRS